MAEPDRGVPDATNDAVNDTGRLRDISDRILAELSALRKLEQEARHLLPGTPEFQRLSKEIQKRSRDVFRLAEAQVEEGERLPPQSKTIAETDS